MPFVADASIVAAWLPPDEDDALSRAALQALRRGRLDEGRTGKAISILNRLPIETDREPNDAHVIRIARRRQLTVNDAAYLELALRLGLPMATRDARMAKAALEEGATGFG